MLRRTLNRFRINFGAATIFGRQLHADPSPRASEMLGDTDAHNFLQMRNLKITQAASGNIFDIDLDVEALPNLYESLWQLTQMSHCDIMVHEATSGQWVDLLRVKKIRSTTSGYIELAVTDRRTQRLAGRYSLSLWKHTPDGLQSLNERAPIKKVRKLPLHLGTSTGVREDFDAIFTWVNSADPDWFALYSAAGGKCAGDPDRYSQADELRYSLRALRLYAPWIRKVFIFSNCKPPEWFIETDDVKWVWHSEVIPAKYLPTFNSHAIESFLHKIPGLARKFLYLNDDFFINACTRSSDFFTPYGQTISRLEPYGAVPYLEELCSVGEAEEWQHAAVNCSNLILNRFGSKPRQLHQHVPYAFDRDIFSQMELDFPKEFEITRSQRFRSRVDFSLASFLYHHYALRTGHAWEKTEESLIVRHTNFARFLKSGARSKFFCINDGGGSALDAGFLEFKNRFLPTHFKIPTAAEKS